MPELNNTRLGDTQVIPRNVSMYAEQWQIVDQMDQDLNLGNTSSALRIIVDRHPKLTAEVARLKAMLFQIAKDAGVDDLPISFTVTP